MPALDSLVNVNDSSSASGSWLYWRGCGQSAGSIYSTDGGDGKSKVSIGIRFFPRKYFFFIDECLSRVMHIDSLWVLPLVTGGWGVSCE